MQPSSAVLGVYRPVVQRAVELCLKQPDLPSLSAALPAYADELRALKINPDPFDVELAAQGSVDFTAWGFEPNEPDGMLADFSNFVKIVGQESNGRLAVHCVITAMKTGWGKGPSLVQIQDDWLKTIGQLTATASRKHERLTPKTSDRDETQAYYFDISTPEALQSISLMRVGHKIELGVMRASGKAS